MCIASHCAIARVTLFQCSGLAHTGTFWRYNQSMVDIFNYSNYREYLCATYESEKKNKDFWSYRYISQKVGINQGYVLKVFQGKTHLGVKNIGAFADFLGLEGRQRQYWEELVHYGRAEEESEVFLRFKRLQEIKGIHLQTLKQSQMDFFKHVRHIAVRSLLGITKVFDDYRALAEMLHPQATVQDVEESIALLNRLGFILRGEDGSWQVVDLFVSTGEGWKSDAIRGFQEETMHMALQSFLKDPLELRDISSATITLASTSLQMVRDRIKDFRKDIFRLSQEGDNDNMVFQLNVQLFPLGIDGENPGQKVAGGPGVETTNGFDATHRLE